MEKTCHALRRMQQRGLNDSILEVIVNGGQYERAPGGATRVFFGNKEYQHTIGVLKKIIQLLDKAKGGTLIINQDRIITIYRAKHSCGRH